VGTNTSFRGVGAYVVAGLCNTASSAADTLRQAVDPRFPSYRVRHPRLLDGGRLRSYDFASWQLLSFIADYADHHDEYFLHFTTISQASTVASPRPPATVTITTDEEEETKEVKEDATSSTTSSITQQDDKDFTIISLTTHNLLLIDAQSQTLLQSLPLHDIAVIQPATAILPVRIGYVRSDPSSNHHPHHNHVNGNGNGHTDNLIWLSLPLSTLFTAQLRRICGC
jgi:hypothetical protein